MHTNTRALVSTCRHMYTFDMLTHDGAVGVTFKRVVNDYRLLNTHVYILANITKVNGVHGALTSDPHCRSSIWRNRRVFLN